MRSNNYRMTVGTTDDVGVELGKIVDKLACSNDDLEDARPKGSGDSTQEEKMSSLSLKI